MPQPFTISFGPWAPDLNNVGIQMPYQFSATLVPCADVNNIYYADGAYKSLPTPAVVSIALDEACIGASTAIAPNGAPVVFAGTADSLFSWNGTSWERQGPTVTINAEQWGFAQYGTTLYAVTGSAYGTDQPFGVAIGAEGPATGITPLPLCGAQFTGSSSGTTLTVTAITSGALAVGMAISVPGEPVNPAASSVYILSFSSGTGGTGTYTLSSSLSLPSQALIAGLAPVGNVIAAVGQFLVLADILASYNLANPAAYQLGTGNGSAVTFSGVIPNVPVLPGGVTVGTGTAITPTVTTGSHAPSASAGTDGGFGYYDGTTGQDFSSFGSITSASLSGVGTINYLGVYGAYTHFPTYWIGQAYLQITGASAPPAQNSFSSLAWTDTNGAQLFYANAAEYSVSGNTATWAWNYAAYHGSVNTAIQTTPFTGTTTAMTFAGVGVAESIPDNGAGAFSKSGPTGGTGTIDYETGLLSITFNTAPASGVDVLVGYATEWPSRVWWSGIDAPTLWPIPLTNAALAVQSSYEDLPSQFGRALFIAAYPLYMVIFQRLGITTATYQGGAVVFSFAQISQNRGLVAQGAAVQVGPITYFLSDEGFFATDGANVIPIGTTADNSAGIDHWFWSNVNTAALNAIRAAYDARTRCVYFAICTGANTTPDTLLIYNPAARRWTRTTAAPCTLIWTDNDGTDHRLGLIDASAKYNLLTGAPAPGYCESCDVQFVDGLKRYVMGVRPQVNCTDTPSVIVGTRDTLNQPLTYSASASPDPFTGIAPVLAEGFYTRLRVTSSAIQTLHGGTLLLEQGGMV